MYDPLRTPTYALPVKLISLETMIGRLFLIRTFWGGPGAGAGIVIGSNAESYLALSDNQ